MKKAKKSKEDLLLIEVFWIIEKLEKQKEEFEMTDLEFIRLKVFKNFGEGPDPLRFILE